MESKGASYTDTPSYFQVTTLSPGPPVYSPDFNFLYQEWIQSVGASKALETLQTELSRLRKELESAETSLKKLNADRLVEQMLSFDLHRISSEHAFLRSSSTAFEALHSKKNPLSSLLASKSEKQRERDRQEHAKAEFERAHSEETKYATLLETLKVELAQMERKSNNLSAKASSSNDLWIKLCGTPEAQSTTFGQFAGTIGEQMEKISIAELALEASSKVTADLTRARLAIQHAHQYYSLALHVTDELKPATRGSRIVEGLAGDLSNMSRQNEYRGIDSLGFSLANKAQVCLDEFFRVTESYLHMFSEDRIDDYNALKKGGVKQVTKIHDLLYNGSSSSTSIRGSIQELVEEQERTFGCLTRLAVFIQDRVPACESQEKEAMTARDNERATLANIWRGRNAQ